MHKPVDSEDKFSWLEIHEFKYEEGLFGFTFRYNLIDEYRTCLLGKESREQGSAKPVFNDLQLLHPHVVKLKAPKVIEYDKAYAIRATNLSSITKMWSEITKKLLKHTRIIVGKRVPPPFVDQPLPHFLGFHLF